MKPVDYELCQHAEQIQALIVSWFVCWQDYTKKNYSTDFHKIRWKGGTWATEETIRFW